MNFRTLNLAVATKLLKSDKTASNRAILASLALPRIKNGANYFSVCVFDIFSMGVTCGGQNRSYKGLLVTPLLLFRHAQRVPVIDFQAQWGAPAKIRQPDKDE